MIEVLDVGPHENFYREHLRDAIRTLDAPPATKEETGSTGQETGAGA